MWKLHIIRKKLTRNMVRELDAFYAIEELLERRPKAESEGSHQDEKLPCYYLPSTTPQH